MTIVRPRTVIPGTVAGRSMLLSPAARPYTVEPRTLGAPDWEAQRFYFRASTPAEVEPVFDGAWGASPQFARRLLGATPDAPGVFEVPNASSWTSGQTCIERQYVGPMLRGGISFGGATVSCVLKPREISSDDNVTTRLNVRIVSADGSVVRAVLLDIGDYGTGLEVDVHPDASTRIAANAEALASYITQPGDRPVVEVGYGDTAGTTPQARGYYGSAITPASDAPLADSGSSALIPWIEFTPAAA